MYIIQEYYNLKRKDNISKIKKSKCKFLFFSTYYVDYKIWNISVKIMNLMMIDARLQIMGMG